MSETAFKVCRCRSIASEFWLSMTTLVFFQLCKFGFQIALYSCHCFLPRRKFRAKLYSQQIQQFACPNVPSEVPGLKICSPPRTVLSNKSHDKVDFHVLFQYKPRSLSFTTNTFASTQLSLNCPFSLFNLHPISYTRIDLGKNREVVRDWFD